MNEEPATEHQVVPATVDLASAVTAHCALFNSCVATGDWTPFVATFAEDAVLRLTGTRFGPVHGRGGIARAYAAAPPDQTMTIGRIQPVEAGTVRVGFTWASGEPGEMLVTWHAGQVTAVETTLPTRRPTGS
jgi:hypothetical protein